MNTGLAALGLAGLLSLPVLAQERELLCNGIRIPQEWPTQANPCAYSNAGPLPAEPAGDHPDRRVAGSLRRRLPD
jgi:hypothetical protein